MPLHAGESVEGFALRVLEAQRAFNAALPGQARFSGVGGFAQLTTVRKGGIETRIIKRWADKVGERIAA